MNDSPKSMPKLDILQKWLSFIKEPIKMSATVFCEFLIAFYELYQWKKHSCEKLLVKSLIINP